MRTEDQADAPSVLTSTSSPPPPKTKGLPGVLVRGAVGGSLMGLANLVPGISGGTMLLATGVYPRFVSAVAEVSTLRLRLPSLALLATIAASALVSVVLLAGLVKDWVVFHRWIAYSLFIGLTLGGVPVISRMIGELRPAVWIGAGAGVTAMGLLLLVQQTGGGALAGSDGNAALLLLAGVGGASAMVLPGISGGYILLVLGQYVPILGAIEACRAAIGAGDLSAVTAPLVSVLLPVAIGIAVGVIVVSNVIRLLLERFRAPTLGVLLGLLVGAVFGLWPFRAPVRPAAGDSMGGEVLTEASAAALAVEAWPVTAFTPSLGQVLLAALLVATGFAVTSGVAWLGRALEGGRV